MFRKYAANLQENTHVEVWFATLLKSHFGVGVFLGICCIFPEHLFIGTLQSGCFCHWFKRNISNHPKRFFKKLLDRVLCCALNLCFLCHLASGINCNTPRYRLILCRKVIIATLQLRQWHCCSSFVKVACLVNLKLVFTD